MSELGAGSGTSYPGTLDTDTTLEVDSPASGKTRARAAVPNDLAAAIIAVETELGTDPAGSLVNVKTFLQTEHDVDGTHGAITASTISATGQITSTLATGTAPLVVASTTQVANLAVTTTKNLAMTDEASATGATATTTLSVGQVTSGDRIFVSAYASFNTASATSGLIYVAKNTGTATIQFAGGAATLPNLYYAQAASSFENSVSGIVEVTGSGTLTLASVLTGASSGITNKIYAFFLKKQ